jgi:ubiquitin carboxyl-terminal hydrolase 2/21
MKGLGGILNMGATCYANAVLQALRHSEKLAWIFSENGHATLFKKDASPLRSKQQEAVESIASVSNLLRESEKGQIVRPAEFWEKIHAVTKGTGYEHFRQKAPHDAHEFYTFLMDTIHESTAITVEMRVLADKESLQAQALEIWKRAFEKQYSPFVDQFYGLFHTTLTCGGCGAVSHNWEPFTSLKLSMPAEGEPSLNDLMDAEFKPETIEGYSCDKCSPVRTTATRNTSIWRLPQYLVVVLKRFTMTGQKITTKVGAISLSNVSFEKIFSEKTTERSGNTSYSLYAIVDHHGSSMGGHYTTQAFHKGDNSWYLYDDESSHTLSAPIFGGTTYMLFFQRKN